VAPTGVVYGQNNRFILERFESRRNTDHAREQEEGQPQAQEQVAE